MKKLSLILALILTITCFVGCNDRSSETSSSEASVSGKTEKAEIPEWQDEAVKKAITELKNTHKKLVTPENEADQYLEIKHTRLISIKPSTENDGREIFNDVKYVVEFMLLTNQYGASPYYFYSRDSYAIYDMGFVKEHDAFNLYRSMGYSVDFSEIIDEIYDLGSAYNEVFDLKEYVPTAAEPITLPDPKPVAEGVSVEIRDEGGNVLLTNMDIKTVSAVFRDEQYYLKLEFTEGGAGRLKDATEQNIGKKLPLYVNNALLSMPEVGDVISDGAMMLNCVDEFTLLDFYEKLTESE